MDNFTSQDICDIIKTCGEVGVVELTLKDFNISFQTREEVHIAPTPFITHPNQEAVSTKEFINDESFAKEGEAAYKEAQLANMVVEDPVEYERLMSIDDLIEEDNGTVAS